MTKAELLTILREQEFGDPEASHTVADAALISFIADPEIEEAYDAVSKWYA